MLMWICICCLLMHLQQQRDKQRHAVCCSECCQFLKQRQTHLYAVSFFCLLIYTYIYIYIYAYIYVDVYVDEYIIYIYIYYHLCAVSSSCAVSPFCCLLYIFFLSPFLSLACLLSLLIIICLFHISFICLCLLLLFLLSVCFFFFIICLCLLLLSLSVSFHCLLTFLSLQYRVLRVQGLGFRVQGLCAQLSVKLAKCLVGLGRTEEAIDVLQGYEMLSLFSFPLFILFQGLGFRVQGLGFRVQGLGGCLSLSPYLYRLSPYLSLFLFLFFLCFFLL